MIVSEAVELLLKLPQSNILVADILIGTGTNNGFSYVRIKQFEDEEE